LKRSRNVLNRINGVQVCDIRTNVKNMTSHLPQRGLTFPRSGYATGRHNQQNKTVKKGLIAPRGEIKILIKGRSLVVR